MNISHYTIFSKKITEEHTLAVLADLHGAPSEEILASICEHHPSEILIPGDLMEHPTLTDPSGRGYATLRACASIAPTYYSLGNHEMGCCHNGNHFAKPKQKPLPDNFADLVASTGAHLLDNTAKTEREISFCGLRSGLDGRKNEPNRQAIRAFDGLSGMRILLCHHPEYYLPYLKDTSIDLIVAGHAHGGQWRIFGRGIYAPGQGLLPKYTSGVTDGRLVISRGLGNHTRIPRIWNPPEAVLIHLLPS